MSNMCGNQRPTILKFLLLGRNNKYMCLLMCALGPMFASKIPLIRPSITASSIAPYFLAAAMLSLAFNTGLLWKTKKDGKGHPRIRFGLRVSPIDAY